MWLPQNMLALKYCPLCRLRSNLHWHAVTISVTSHIKGIDPYSEIFNSANILGGTPEAEEAMAKAKVFLDEGVDPDMFKDSKQSTALIKVRKKNN